MVIEDKKDDRNRPLLELFEIKRTFDLLLDSVGVSYGNNRFDQGIKIFKTEIENKDFKPTHVIRNIIADIFELSYILDLHTKGILSRDHLRQILPIITKGVLLKADRTDADSDKAREKMFEILLLSKLNDAGLDVKYESGNDIRFIHEGKNYAVECKRIRNVTGVSVKNNLRKAYHQLDRVRTSCDRALVAIGIEEHSFGRDQVVFAEDEKAAKEILYLEGRGFVEKYRHHWQRKTIIKDKEYCPAVVVCVRGPVFAFKTNVTASGFTMTINNTMVPVNSEFKEIKFLENIHI